MKAIVAVDQNWGIGKNGGLLTHLPEDLRFFRTMTKGKVVIMGRKTLLSFPGGKPLKDRVNIVLTTDVNFKQDGIVVCSGIEKALRALLHYADEECFVIGGQSVYEQLLDYCDTVYVTYMRAELQPDTFFVNLDERAEWDLSKVSEDKAYEGLHYEYRTYQRRTKAKD